MKQLNQILDDIEAMLYISKNKEPLYISRSRTAEGFNVVTGQGHIFAQGFDTEKEAQDWIKVYSVTS